MDQRPANRARLGWGDTILPYCQRDQNSSLFPPPGLSSADGSTSEAPVWMVSILIAVICTFQGYCVAKLFTCTFWMVSCNISVFTILFKTAYQALLLIMYNYYGCPVNYVGMVQIYSYSFTCGSDLRSNSKAYKPTAKKNVRSIS